jgi:hypothetical protein
MNLQQRINLLARLGKYMLNDSEEWNAEKKKAYYENAWFITEFIDLSVKNIAIEFLQKEKLEAWVKKYAVDENNFLPKNIGVVMAGNIPLVGFHDFLCVFISGNKITIKPSSKDFVLINHLLMKMSEWNDEMKQYFSFAEMIKGCDAYIATGSNNSGRYFEYYFGKYPHIIRRNRTSVGILDGTETKHQLELLADDIQLYFGLGCRNITKLYVPENYDFLPLINALKKYDFFLDFHKYKHNYDYQFALLMMNNKLYMNSGAVLLSEDSSVFSAISRIHYEFYTDRTIVARHLQNNSEIQCIVGNGFIDFGKAQQPALNDYADGIDTMDFLKKL